MQKEGPTRTALQGVVSEFDISTEPTDIDLRAFIVNHTDQMQATLQRELDTNT